MYESIMKSRWSEHPFAQCPSGNFFSEKCWGEPHLCDPSPQRLFDRNFRRDLVMPLPTMMPPATKQSRASSLVEQRLSLKNGEGFNFSYGKKVVGKLWSAQLSVYRIVYIRIYGTFLIIYRIHIYIFIYIIYNIIYIYIISLLAHLFTS